MRFFRLDSELGELLSSFLGNPTAIADLAPIETSPALVSTLEAYLENVQDNTEGAVPTAPPAFITAFPTAAQNDFTRIFAEENSIISANGGLNTNGIVPLPDSSLPRLNSSLTASTNSTHSLATETSQARVTSKETSPSMLVTARTSPSPVTATPSSASTSTVTATGGASQAAGLSVIRDGLGVFASIVAFFWL